MRKLKVNPYFRQFMRPLKDEEFRQLEVNIVTAGKVRDKICIWKDQIVDGMHRYLISEKHDIPFEVDELEFSSELDAVSWIAENQYGRRNCDEQFMRYLAGKEWLAKANKVGRPAEALKDNDKSTAKKRRDAKFAEAVDMLSEGARKKVLTGEAKLTNQEAKKLSNLTKQKADQLVESAAKRGAKVKVAAECPKGGQHKFEEGSCEKCGEPDTEATLKRLRGMAATLAKWHVTLDEMNKLCPYEELASVHNALNKARLALEKWAKEYAKS